MHSAHAEVLTTQAGMRSVSTRRIENETCCHHDTRAAELAATAQPGRAADLLRRAVRLVPEVAPLAAWSVLYLALTVWW
ncbi:hypothetical protein ACFZC5_10900 [Nocardia gamkensis]|uniref:hypothetical protein n=1 Tax=Nocardia gamkensis TaxID=352869 RepID=UPI0036F01CD4